VINALLAEPSNPGRQHAVAVCGDVFFDQKLFGDSVSRAAGLTLIRCPEDQDEAFSLFRSPTVSLVVVRQAFIEQLPSADFVQLTNHGKGSYVLAILESDTLEKASAAKMLRLGCRGVLPRRFSLELFSRATTAILRGEMWAPRGVVSELLSDLLRAASLKSENGLTPQEARILELTMQGYKNSAIADALFISMETVRWHKRRLNRKLGGPVRSPQAKAAPPARELAENTNQARTFTVHSRTPGAVSYGR
jgi:DNA-binding NarL/FixJ family response regulator